MAKAPVEKERRVWRNSRDDGSRRSKIPRARGNSEISQREGKGAQVNSVQKTFKERRGGRDDL